MVTAVVLINQICKSVLFQVLHLEQGSTTNGSRPNGAKRIDKLTALLIVCRF